MADGGRDTPTNTSAMMDAVEQVWPATTVRGCYFHHKQALFRKLQQHNLVEEYRVPESDIRRYFQMMGAIAFVPEDDVPTAWRFLKPLLPLDMVEFSSYFENTWIGTSSRDPTFARSKWNLHDSTKMLLPRSSNLAEGWHHGFHSMLSCNNPTIWKFLECLKAEQSLTDVKLTRRLLRQPPEKRAAKWIKYDQRLQTIVDSYDDYDILDFLKVVGCMV